MTDAFQDLSHAVAAHVKRAAPLIVGLDWGSRQQISAVLWQDGLVVTSEQSLPETDAAMAILPGGARVPALPIGRDASTNVAVLRVQAPAEPAQPHSYQPRPAPPDRLDIGALVLALGSDGAGGTRARLGAVETLGPAWHSQCGGRIDQLIRLDVNLGHAAEGGPVLDADGRLLGMSTFGPRQQVLVIPTATIDRVVAQLQAHGRVPRGWLGVGVQPVQIPDEIASAHGVASGLMVLSIAEGAPAAGIVLPGDILLAAGDTRLPTPRALTLLLGPESVGSTLRLCLLRAGATHHCDVEVVGRPA